MSINSTLKMVVAFLNGYFSAMNLMKSSIIWDVMLCGPLKVSWRFGGKCCLFGLFFDPEDGGNMLVRDVEWLSTDHTALHPRRKGFAQSPPWEPQVLEAASCSENSERCTGLPNELLAETNRLGLNGDNW
jgi:hypothetical protein